MWYGTMGLSTGDLEPPLDDVAFLARSNNRVRVLEELAEGERTRGDLRDRTEMSRPTIGRILEGFVERTWVEETDRTYELTPFGALVAEAFEELLDVTGTVQQLRAVGTNLPLDWMDFDLHRLADATITTPSATDAAAHFRREAEVMRETDRVQFLCNDAYAPTIETYRDRVVEDGMELDAVIAADAIRAASDDETIRPLVMDLAASDHTTIYRYDGPVEMMLGALDHVATIVPLDDSGVPSAFIEVEDPVVREWVETTLEDYRERSGPVTLESLAP